MAPCRNNEKQLALRRSCASIYQTVHAPKLLERKEGQLGCQSSSGFQLTQFETDTAFTLYTEHCTGGRKFRSTEISALWISKQVLILFGFPAVSKRNCGVIEVMELIRFGSREY
jgi:hypothetical protein